MTDVAEAFFQTAMERGEYCQMNPHVVARIFLGMFTVAGFSQSTLTNDPTSHLELKEMAETLADIFLNGPDLSASSVRSAYLNCYIHAR